MKKRISTGLITLASLVMFASVAIAIDTVPLPEKPRPNQTNPKMIGTWPTPEKPRPKYTRGTSARVIKAPTRRGLRRAPRPPRR